MLQLLHYFHVDFSIFTSSNLTLSLQSIILCVNWSLCILTKCEGHNLVCDEANVLFGLLALLLGHLSFNNLKYRYCPLLETFSHNYSPLLLHSEPYITAEYESHVQISFSPSLLAYTRVKDAREMRSTLYNAIFHTTWTIIDITGTCGWWWHLLTQRTLTTITTTTTKRSFHVA